MTDTFKQEIKLFYCYAHEDKSLRDELEIHLSWLRRRYQLTSWYDREILPGEDWEQAIDKRLNTAHLILLLISPDFMASDYIYGKEMRRALERHKEGACRVIPIVLRPTYWKDAPFSTLQMLPTDAKPITRWYDRDEAFQDVVTEISRIIKDLLTSFKTKEDWLKEGYSLTDLKRYEEALTAFDQVIRLDPNDAAAYNGKGRVLAELKRHEEALIAYEQAIRVDANGAAAYNSKGNTLFNLERYEEALIAYEQAIRFDPNFAPPYNGKGNALTELERHEEALVAYDQAIRLDPNFSYPHTNKGIAFTELKRYEEALVDFDQAIQLDANDAVTYNGKGNALAELKRYEEAFNAYEQAIRLTPKFIYPYINKGNALFNLERYEEALIAYEQATRLDPNFASVYFNKGITLFNLKRYEEALIAFDQAILLDHNDAVIYFSKGNALFNLKRYEEALLAYDQAISLNSTYAAAYSRKGTVLYELQRHEEALLAFDQAIQLDPSFEVTYDDVSIGDTLTSSKTSLEVLIDLAQTIRLDPDTEADSRNLTDGPQPPTYYRLSHVFVQSGTPEVTFVPRQDFLHLKLALEQPGRGIVIEGPSGVGKTTSVEKAIEDLKRIRLHIPIQQTLSARNPEHRHAIQTLRQWHNGIVIIDDFHRLDSALRQEIVDYLKELADTTSKTKKLVIVGIPRTGQSLVNLSFDLATRIEIFTLGQVSEELILQMIGKGEEALNIIFESKNEIAATANGSLYLAQSLCYYICEMAGVIETQDRTAAISGEIDKAKRYVMKQLAPKYENFIKHFVAMGTARDLTGLKLLEELANAEDGFLSLPLLKASKPEFSVGIERLIGECWMEKLYKACPDGDHLLFYDHAGNTLVIEDPQLAFYLKNVPFKSLAKKVGKVTAVTERRVFISYSHLDFRWLKRLQIHLKPLELEGIVDLWSDKKIKPGFQWRTTILSALETSRVAILLISANFLASDFIKEHELPILLERAKAGGTTIIPIILSPCLFTNTSLSAYQAINNPERPLSKMTLSNQDQIFAELAQNIMRIFQAE